MKIKPLFYEKILFRAPGDETARAYLQIWKDKAGRREEAFAAMRRVAAELGLEHGAGAFDASARALDPAQGLSSAEAASDSGAGSLSPFRADAAPSPQPLDPWPTFTTVARTHDRTTPPSRSEAASPATSSAAPPPVLQTATTTQRLPGQQTRIFYFFSPRCPSCAQQTPLLNAAARGRRDVVGIAMETTREEVRAHVGQMHIGFPVTLDQGESKAFGVTAYPTLVLLDAAGKATRLQGLVTRSELQRLLGGGP
ncbi:MAG TPA: TlpA disulfide reductase family protein [bacterium]